MSAEPALVYQADLFRTDTQEDAILRLFVELDYPMTPFQVRTALSHRGKQWPITSVRRAMSNLTSAGKLVKTTETREEQYGKTNHCWKLPERRPRGVR